MAVVEETYNASKPFIEKKGGGGRGANFLKEKFARLDLSSREQEFAKLVFTNFSCLCDYTKNRSDNQSKVQETVAKYMYEETLNDG